VVAIAVAATLYIRKQRSHVVKALVDVEEGEKRNYKINFSELVTENAIGAGGFGVVYKGEYPFWIVFPEFYFFPKILFFFSIFLNESLCCILFFPDLSSAEIEKKKNEMKEGKRKKKREGKRKREKMKKGKKKIHIFFFDISEV
jgi:hypothetical protein